MFNAISKNRRVWLHLLLLVTGTSALGAESVPTAQPDPALARGFAPEQLFQGFAELDTVNAFNGNLTISLSIGQEYPLGGGFSYQLSLVYNSQIWDIRTVNNGLGSWNKARPARSSNAGVGWALHLGQLFHPDDLANDATRGEWLYVSADGGSHLLYPTLHPEESYVHPANRYSRDGTYLRYTEVSSTVRTVEDAGIVRRFECWSNCSGISKWRLTRVEDPFGNFLAISYSADNLTWTLTDSQSRTHVVVFEPVTGDDYYDSRLQEVRLAAFGGQTAVYSFTYIQDGTRRGCPHNLANAGIFTSSYLDRLDLPDGSRFRFTYYFDTNEPSDACTVNGGRLKQMTLPSQGRICWTYQRYFYPNEIIRMSRHAGTMSCKSLTLLHLDRSLWYQIKDKAAHEGPAKGHKRDTTCHRSDSPTPTSKLFALANTRTHVSPISASASGDPRRRKSTPRLGAFGSAGRPTAAGPGSSSAVGPS